MHAKPGSNVKQPVTCTTQNVVMHQGDAARTKNHAGVTSKVNSSHEHRDMLRKLW